MRGPARNRARSAVSSRNALAVDLDLALAFLDDGADAGRRQHASQTAAAGANALDEACPGARGRPRPGWPASAVCAFGLSPIWLAVSARYQRRVEQFANAFAGDRGVIADNRETRIFCCRTTSSSRRSGVPTPMNPPTMTVAPLESWQRLLPRKRLHCEAPMIVAWTFLD